MTAAVRALALGVLLPGFVGTTVPGWLHDRLARGLAGVCLFGQNVEDDEQVRALAGSVRAARRTALVASDEEGGSVTRLDARTGSPWPGHAALGALDDEQATYDVALGLGARACSAGVDLVLAPVVDVGSEPDNPVIGVRSFGATADLVARHGVAFVRGLQDAGVAACVKHYPGHGATRTDSHLDLPVLDVDEATWRERDVAPFAATVAAGVACVMTAHVVVAEVDDRPATMSPVLLGLLREELGFDGVVVTDALDMRAISAGVGRARGAVLALAAGADLLCVGNPAFPDGYDAEAVLDEIVDAVEAAVLDGTLPLDRLEDAARRVAALSDRLGAAPDDATGPDQRAGAAVAARAVQVRGDVALAGDDVLVVATVPRVAYAAGRVRSALLAELAGRRPSWQVVEVDGPESVEQALASGTGDGSSPRDVLVVSEGRPDPVGRAAVAAVLARVPGAVVVHGGLPRSDDAGERTVHTYGTSAATAHAVADLLLREDA